MAALIALALVSAVPVPTVDRIGRWEAYIHEAADRAALPESWIRRVIRAESAGRTTLGGQPITSRAGAMGLMQLMPATWAAMRARLGLGSDPFDPHDNILAGAVFLRMMYDRFGYPGLFGAYNAGAARYAAFVKGRPLPDETVGYLAKVAGDEAGPAMPSSRAGAAPHPGLFVVLRTGTPSGSAQAEAPSDLFALRHQPPLQKAEIPPHEGGE